MRMKWKIDLWAIDLSTFFLDSAVYEQCKECFLRNLLGDHSGTKPIEVNNFDKSKRRSLHSLLRVDVIGKPGPAGDYCPCIKQEKHLNKKHIPK